MLTARNGRALIAAALIAAAPDLVEALERLLVSVENSHNTDPEEFIDIIEKMKIARAALKKAGVL